MNWDDLRVFLALAKTRSLKSAGKLLKIDQTSVGRRIRHLEESIGSKLFEKRSNGFFLTSEGEKIFELALSMEESASSISRQVLGTDAKLEGDIKLAMPGAMANHLIIPLLKKFQDQYPAIKIHLLTGAEVVNLSKREADIAFRLVKPTQKELIIKRLGNIELKIYGHKTLLEKRPVEHIKDLSQFPFICLNDHALSASERVMREGLNGIIESNVFTSAWSTVYYSISAKLGLGILPTFLGGKDKDLRTVDLIPSAKSSLWSVVHPDLQKNHRVRVFLEYMKLELKDHLS